MLWIPPSLSGLCNSAAVGAACSHEMVLFLSLLASLFSTPKYKYPDVELDQVDFVIVGGGTSGCLVADRLSKHFKVLLVEAGHEPPEATEIPGLNNIIRTTDLSWRYLAAPAKNCFLSEPERRPLLTRGKMLGGSLATSSHVYFRGFQSDYKKWEDAGDVWSWDNIQATYKYLEDNQDLDYAANKQWHGTGGDLPVQTPGYGSVYSQGLIKALTELGVEEIDSNTDIKSGVGKTQYFMKDGRHVDTYNALLKPKRTYNANLRILKGATATKLVIDEQGSSATAVEYVVDGMLYQVAFTKEVILAAGAINTPKILMASGIGPGEDLSQIGVPVVASLPVGRNLQDRITFNGLIFSGAEALRKRIDFRADLDSYLSGGRGPLAGPGPTNFVYFFSTASAADSPNMQAIGFGVSPEDFQQDVRLGAAVPVAYTKGLMVAPVLLKPTSRGVVSLNPTDPIYGEALVDLNPLSQPEEVQQLVESCLEILRLNSSLTLRSLMISIVDTPMPHCAVYLFGTPNYCECLVRVYTRVLSQPTGTCKMGSAADPAAVVDQYLKVRAVHGIRVADSSVIPETISGHNLAATVMLAQKASDILLEEYLY